MNAPTSTAWTGPQNAKWEAAAEGLAAWYDTINWDDFQAAKNAYHAWADARLLELVMYANELPDASFAVMEADRIVHCEYPTGKERFRCAGTRHTTGCYRCARGGGCARAGYDRSRSCAEHSPRIANIAKMGRKCGVRIRVVLQDPKVDELGSGTLREQLQQGTIVLLRTGGKTSSRLALGGSLDTVNPAGIPPRFPNGTGTQGLGYIANGEKSQGRMFRAAWVRDPLDWITGDETRLERSSWDAAGLWYATYREWLDADRRGENVSPEPPGNEHDETDVKTAAPSRTNTGERTRSQAPSKVSERIVALLAEAGGPMARQQLVVALTDEGIDASANAVSAALKRRATSGDVVNLGHGLWAHTTHAQALAA